MYCHSRTILYSYASSDCVIDHSHPIPCRFLLNGVFLECMFCYVQFILTKQIYIPLRLALNLNCQSMFCCIGYEDCQSVRRFRTLFCTPVSYTGKQAKKKKIYIYIYIYIRVFVPVIEFIFKMFIKLFSFFKHENNI